MILSDKSIKKLSQTVFLEGYDESNVQSVSYDLITDKIIKNNTESPEYRLHPNEMVMIKCKEKLRIPNDMVGKVVDKNSRIRQRLLVTSPVYQPGHETFIYFRVQNVSENIINLQNNESLAQIMFEKLDTIPDMTYNNNKNASFNDEFSYRGMGKYKSAYEKEIERLEEAKEDLNSKESSIYANILTMMGIFVSIFSLITINFSNATANNFNVDLVLTMNLSLGIIVTLFMGLILFFINKNQKKWHFIVYISILVVLMVLLCFKIL